MNKNSHLYFSIIAAVVSPVLYGVSLTLSGLIGERIKASFTENAELVFKIFNLLIFAGALISNIIFSQYSVEKTKLMMLSSLLFFSGFMLIVFDNLYLIYIGRICQGFAAGIIGCTVPCYLSTISPLHLRGAVSSLYPMGILSGIIIGSAFCLINENSSLILIILGSLALVHSFISMFSIKHSQPSGLNGSSFMSLIKEPKARRSLFIMATSHIAQNMSGLNHILFNSHTIFVGFDARKMLIFLFLFALLISIFSSSIVDRFGRKSLLLSSSFVIILSCIAFYFSWYPQVSSFLYILGFNLGLNSIPFVLIGEIFPVEYMSQGGLFGTSCNFLGGILSMLIPPGGTEKFNPAFLVYAVSLAVFMIIIKSFYTETKGKLPTFQ